MLGQDKGTANTWSLISTHSSLWTSEGGTRDGSTEGRVQALHPSHRHGVEELLKCHRVPQPELRTTGGFPNTLLRVPEELTVHVLRPYQVPGTMLGTAEGESNMVPPSGNSLFAKAWAPITVT